MISARTRVGILPRQFDRIWCCVDFFFFFTNFLFIYFWWLWVFNAAHGLSQGWCSGFLLPWLLFLWSMEQLLKPYAGVPAREQGGSQGDGGRTEFME